MSESGYPRQVIEFAAEIAADLEAEGRSLEVHCCLAEATASLMYYCSEGCVKSVLAKGDDKECRCGGVPAMFALGKLGMEPWKTKLELDLGLINKEARHEQG